MGEKLEKLAVGIAHLMQLGSIAALAYIGLKRNKDAYNAEMRAIDAEIGVEIADVKLGAKDIEIEKLKKKIEELENEKKVQA